MATLTVYPQPGSGAGSSDARVYRQLVDETFSTIRNGNGTNVEPTTVNTVPVQILCSNTVNQFDTISRGLFSFDTIPLGGSSITTAVISFSGTSKANSLVAGVPTFDVFGVNMGNVGSPAASDYQAVLSSSLTTLGISYTAFSIVGYNDFTLSATGITSIVESGFSQFCTRWDWDADNNFGGTWTLGSQVYVFIDFADQTGTTSDPKLVVTFQPRSFVNKNGLKPAVFKPGLAR